MKHQSRATFTYRAVVIAIACCVSANAGADDGNGTPFSVERGERVRSSAEFRGYQQTDVSSGRGELQMSLYDFRLTAPLLRSDVTSVDFTARFSSLDMETRARLPDTFESLPDSLWDFRVGGDIRHRLENGWTVGGSLTVGSAGDRLFASADEWLVGATVFLRVPIDERDAWIFLLDSSNTRDFVQFVPLPGVGYAFERDGGLDGIIGLPFTRIRFEATDRLALDVSYVFVRTVHAKVSYELHPSVEVFAAFDWDRRTYFRHDRRDHDDRLFYYEKRAVGGVNWEIRDNTYLTVAAGYAFDRFFFEGEEFDDRGDNRIDIGDGALVQVRLAISF